MSGEFDIYGVFVPSLGIWMLIAFAATRKTATFKPLENA